MPGSPRTPNRRLRAGAVGVVASGALLLGACGSDSGTATVEPDTTEESSATRDASMLFAASEQTSAAETGRMRMTMTISGSDGSQSMDASVTAEGEFDNVNQRSRMEMDFGDFLAQMAESTGESVPSEMAALQLVQIIDGTNLYMKFEGAAIPGMPAGWISMDASQVAGQSGLGGQGMGSPFGSLDGPQGFLAGMQETGATVDAISDDTYEGEDVTRYEGTLDLEAAVAAADPEARKQLEKAFSQFEIEPMPFVAWVDEDGMVRKMDLDMSIAADGMSMDMTMSMELFDLGSPVDIQVPAPSEVTPLDPSLMGAMGAGTA
jgi:hypothetical protein